MSDSNGYRARRYTIRSVTGFRITERAAHLSPRLKPRTTYYVLDRLYAWAVVHETDNFAEAVQTRRHLNWLWHG